VGKKKKKNQPTPDAAPARLARAPFLTPRRSAVICVGLLFALWLIQYFGVLFGSANLWEDIVQMEYPHRVFARMALFGGEFPHWIPYTFGGMPFFAAGTGILYPFNALVSLLPLGDRATWWLLQTFVTSHVLIAGVCMFFYLRFKGRTDSASLFGAVAFMFGGYMVTHVIHTGIIYTVAWMPLMLMLLERGIREMKPKYAVIGGLTLGAVMQAGHAQVMFYAIIFILTYAVYYILLCPSNGSVNKDIDNNVNKDNNTGAESRRGDTPPRKSIIQLPPANILIKKTIITASFFVIAAGLCLVQYLPIFEASSHTSRISYTISDASQGSLQFAQLLTALIPKLFGAYTGQESVPAFWLQDTFSRGAHIYWESCFYFGVSTLILALFLFRKIRTDGTVMMAAGWILLSLLIALGGNFVFYRVLFDLGIPGFNSFRHPPRILFIWGFLFPVMAAAVIDSLNDLRTKRMKTVTLSLCAAAVILGIIAAAGGLSAVFPSVNASEGALMNSAEGRAIYASQQGILLLVNALLIGAALTLFFLDKIKVNTAKLLIIACLVVDMLSFAAGQNVIPVEQHVIRNGQPAVIRNDGADVIFRKAQASVDQIKEMRKDGIFRVNTRQYLITQDVPITGHTNLRLMERNQGYVSGIEITEGYSQFRLKYESLPLYAGKFNVLLDLMNIKYYVNPYLQEGDQNIVLTNDTYLPRAKLFYKAKVIGNGKIDLGNDEQVLNYMNSTQYDHRSEVVVKAKAFSGFTGGAGSGKAEITKYMNNRIELDVDTDREAILWMSEIWYPAWTAAVNGNKTTVYRANHSFRAIIVPPGQSKVLFKFESPAFTAGALISLLTLIGALGYLLMERFSKKKLPVSA